MPDMVVTAAVFGCFCAIVGTAALIYPRLTLFVRLAGVINLAAGVVILNYLHSQIGLDRVLL